MKNTKRISLPVFIAVSLFLIIITFQITFLAVTNAYRAQQAQNAGADSSELWEAKLDYVNELAKKYYLNEIPIDLLADLLPATYVSALQDRYSYYMTKEEYQAFNDNMNANLQGIGITVVFNSEKNAVEVVSVMNNSPALESGVKAGDLIFIVEGQSVSELGYNAAMEIMRGEAGTVFNFSVMRPTENGYETVAFSVKRGFVVEETVTFKLYNGNTGMIRISAFDKKTPEQFKAAIGSLIGQGADRFVFDVRYNPGGNLDSICSILDMLVPKGPVIRIIDRYGNESTIDSDEEEFNYPIAVITNGSTASAAELFTATLRDYKKAVIVGETTFGKGVMQSVFALADGSAICMTTQTYCPPFSDSYDKIGITPDKEIKIPEEYSNISIYKLTYDQDTQLKAAVEALK